MKTKLTLLVGGLVAVVVMTVVGCGSTLAERQEFYRQGIRDALIILTNGTVTNVIHTVEGFKQPNEK